MTEQKPKIKKPKICTIFYTLIWERDALKLSGKNPMSPLPLHETLPD